MQHLSRLQPSANYPLAILVPEELALGLHLASLPDLNLAATADDADTHRGEQVVCCVGVHVHTTIEHGGGVLADARRDHGFPTWVVLDEVADVVDDTGNGDQAATILGLVLVVVPFHDWELVERDTPVETGTLLVELLLELLDAALLDFVASELLEVVGEAELLAKPD